MPSENGWIEPKDDEQRMQFISGCVREAEYLEGEAASHRLEAANLDRVAKQYRDRVDVLKKGATAKLP